MSIRLSPQQSEIYLQELGVKRSRTGGVQAWTDGSLCPQVSFVSEQSCC